MVLFSGPQQPASRAARRRAERLLKKQALKRERHLTAPPSRAEMARMILAAHELKRPLVRWPKLARAWVAKCARSWRTWRAMRAEARRLDEEAFLRGVRQGERP